MPKRAIALKIETNKEEYHIDPDLAVLEANSNEKNRYDHLIFDFTNLKYQLHHEPQLIFEALKLLSYEKLYILL